VGGRNRNGNGYPAFDWSGTKGEMMMAPSERDPDKTTVVETGSGGGSGGVIAAVVLVVVVLLLLFLFRGQLGFGDDDVEVGVPEKVDVNVN
jgi:hypothetical protein